MAIQAALAASPVRTHGPSMQAFSDNAAAKAAWMAKQDPAFGGAATTRSAPRARAYAAPGTAAPAAAQSTEMHGRLVSSSDPAAQDALAKVWAKQAKAKAVYEGTAVETCDGRYATGWTTK